MPSYCLLSSQDTLKVSHWTPRGLAHGSLSQLSKVSTMRHCINCCVQLFPEDTHKQQVACQGGPHHSHQACPTCKGENKILFRVDSKQMNLLAVLEVRTEGNENWGGFLRQGLRNYHLWINSENNCVTLLPQK